MANLPHSPTREVDGAAENEVESKPDSKAEIVEVLKDLINEDRCQKYRKYETDYSSYLARKYFEKKTLFGDDVFEKQTRIGDATVPISRWPCTHSFIDPVESFEDHKRLTSTPASNVTPAIPDEKIKSETD